jgi:hypothetical protein
MANLNTVMIQWNIGMSLIFTIKIVKILLKFYNQYFRSSDGRIIRFNALAYKGEKLKVNEERRKEYKPLKRNQLLITFKLLYSDLPDPKYRKQNGVKLLGDLTINLPLKSFGTDGQDRNIEFFLKFAEEELKVTARNKETHETYRASFKYPPDD